MSHPSAQNFDTLNTPRIWQNKFNKKWQFHQSAALLVFTFTHTLSTSTLNRTISQQYCKKIMETALPELLPRTALHLNENSNNHLNHLNANSSTASTTTTKPATSLNADQLHKLSTLRQANDQIILDHTQVITVAEGLTRELQSTTPFQGVDMVILERVEEMVEEAEQNLEAARNQIHDLVTKVEQSDVRNSSAYDTYKRNRDEALPLIAEAQEKRHCVEKGVSTLTESMIATLGDNGADDAMWLEAALQSTEGCKQLLDRQMALMQEIKKEKNTVVEQAERLQDEIEPLKSAVLTQDIACTVQASNRAVSACPSSCASSCSSCCPSQFSCA